MTDPTAASTTPSAADGALPPAYEPKSVEAWWYPVWNEAGVFRASADDVRAGKRPYVIMMPPPNVTGTLHMGHALFVTLQDILVRTHRMRGEAALWLPGVDHAGIATQTVVERELRRHEGKTRHDLGRDKFLERVWDWKKKNGDTIVHQLKAMGASADWTRERFTMDETCNRAVKEAFVRLWNDGLIYRGERLVSWDPVTQTALSDEEVEHEEKDGELWRFAYKVKHGGALVAKSFTSPHDGGHQTTLMLPHDDGEEIVVATTRPETMLGDVAVAVHPDDPRYSRLVGKELVHPFFPERRVVVIADASVDREFGTGAVKITPAHDPNDFDMGQRHQLSMINVFTLLATVNENGGVFQGLDRFVARREVKRVLDELGLYRGTSPIRHNVAVSQRSGAVVEPMLSRQFFVRAKPLADKAYAATQSGETRIVPPWWQKTWDHWMLNIRDWCVSRQLWWGHRIPVFYDLSRLDEAIEADANNKGRETAAVTAQADGVRGRALLKIALATLDDDYIMRLARASTEELERQDPERWAQEDDVLDTWFSSGLWPFSTLGWPDHTDDLRAFYPGSVLETGSDILFFWVARMVMMGCWFMGRSPFADVFLHAMVRDAAGKKMSKSTGNALDPLDVMAGITLPQLLEKTKTYPVPEKKLAGVLKGLEKEFADGIPAAGADGLRFTLAALSAHGRDVKLSVPRAVGYRNLLNKIWNATRFFLMRVGDEPIAALDDVRDRLSLADRWLLSRLQRAVGQVNAAIEAYRFDDAANTLYQFLWAELCDVYIEYAKGPLQEDPSSTSRQAVRAVLVHALDVSMRLLHPICPFITEELWQKLPGRRARWDDVEFCATAPFPTVDATLVDPIAERELGLVMAAVTLIRNARQESGLPPRAPVAVHIAAQGSGLVGSGVFCRMQVAGARDTFAREAPLITRLAVTSSTTVHDRVGFEPPPFSAVQAQGSVLIAIPLEGLIDKDKERARLAREIDKAEKEKAGLAKRFENADFVQRAPPEVVAEGRANLALLDAKLSSLQTALGRLG